MSSVRLEKRERGRIQGLPKFFSTPSNFVIFVGTFLVSIGTKAHYKFREK